MVVFPIKVIAQPTYNNEEYIEIRGYETYPQKSTEKQIYNSCSCVSFAKSLVYYRERVGLARNWPRNSTEPKVGGIVILNESPAGHVAYITKVWAEEFEVDEANYVHCQRSQRIIKINNPDILGFYETP